MGFAPFPVERHSEVVAAWQRHKNLQRVAREVGCHHQTVSKILNRNGINPEIERAQALLDKGKREPSLQVQPASPIAKQPLTARLPDPAPEAGGPSLPEPHHIELSAFDTQLSGNWGVISDIHLPYHDLATVKGWIDDCKSMNVVGILLNGDILDFYQISRFSRDPSKPRMREEIEKGRQLLEYIRSQFPNARIVFKEGNHDERLFNYLITRAAEIFDLDDIQLPRLLRAHELGIEWVADKRIVMLGKLPVIHGHEYQGGGGVMPARWLYLRTGESAMMGHFHQPTFYSYRTITGKEYGLWSLGCACHLGPSYRPYNQWGHGWAVVEVASDRTYHVHLRQKLRTGQMA